MTAPKTSRAFVARLALAQALDRVEKLQERAADAPTIVAVLIEHHDAKISFSGGTNVLRCCGVAGTCTSDKGALLIASWQRIAEHRFGRMNAGASHAPLVANPTMAQAHG